MAMKFLAILAIACFALSECKVGDHFPFCLFYPEFDASLKTTDVNFQLQKYTGVWYEMARKKNPFQKNCHCTNATYGLNSDDSVSVKNTCTMDDGSLNVINGKATKAKKDDNTRLKVKFTTTFFKGNYWILDIDPNYQVVLVGEPCLRFLWVLARDQHLSKTVVDKLIGKAKGLGYEVDDIIYREDNC